jgi:cytoskeletal protein RodZ
VPASSPRDGFNTRTLPAGTEQPTPRRGRIPLFWQVVIVLLLLIVILVLALFLFHPPALPAGSDRASTTTSPSSTSARSSSLPTPTVTTTTSAQQTTSATTTSAVAAGGGFTTPPFQIGLSGVTFDNPPATGDGVKWDVKYDPFDSGTTVLTSKNVMARWPGTGRPTLTDCAGLLAAHGTNYVYSPNTGDQVCVTRGSGAALLAVQKVETNDIVVVMTGQ